MIKITKFFLLVFLLLFPARSEACFVQYSLTFTEAEALSDAIFFGERIGCIDKKEGVFIAYKVTKTWKGDIKDIYLERFNIKNCAELAKIHDTSYLMSMDSGYYLLFRKLNANKEMVRLTADMLCTTSRGGEVHSVIKRFGIDIFFDKKLPEFVVVDRNKEVLTDLRLLGTPLHVNAKGNKQ